MRTLHHLISIVVVSSLASCAGSVADGNAEAPVLLALSTNQITIGKPLDFIGANFVNHTKSSHTEIQFKGEFRSDAGKTYAVDQRIRPRWADGNRVIWPFVGPYMNPFTGKSGDQTGEFVGTVTPIVVEDLDGDRLETEGNAMPATLTFAPSLIVRDFQPLEASCDEPAKRLLGGFAYKISVEAVGFTPVNFTYIIGGEYKGQRPRVYRSLANGMTNSFGGSGELVFAPVPEDEAFYLVGFGIRALGTDGIERSMELVLGVHRPIEYIDTGEVQIAQIEPAKPDSGCLAGGETSGSTVTYTESTTETRTRTLGLTWDESWLDSIQNTQGGSTTRSNSVNWSVSHTDMESYSFGWETSAAVTAGAEGSIPGFAKASLSTTVSAGVRGDHTWGYSDTRSVGGDYTESDTESWATASTRSHTVGQGTSDFWAVSSSDQKSLALTGLILPGRYGVFYRQVTRIAIPGKVVAYNLCGNAEVVADAHFFDYLWSLELAQGETCSPLPESNLPDAECLMAPCGS